MRRFTNKAGVNLIKKWEGWRAKAYLDAVGVWTIGYGHTSRAGTPVVRPGLTITRSVGEAILERDLGQYERAVERAIGDAPCTDNQFAAMVSLCYNVGIGNFARSSVARHMRNQSPRTAATRFAPWNKAGGKVLRGLTRRRADETRLFKTPDGKRTPPPPGEVAAGAGTVAGGVTAATKAVQDGLFEPSTAIAACVFLAVVVGVILFNRSKKT